MYRAGLFFIFIAMLSSASKAFSTPARALIQNRARPSIVSRFMSTEGSGETIVDICKGKIMKALETDEVTVTGELEKVIFIKCWVTLSSTKYLHWRVLISNIPKVHMMIQMDPIFLWLWLVKSLKEREQFKDNKWFTRHSGMSWKDLTLQYMPLMQWFVKLQQKCELNCFDILIK